MNQHVREKNIFLPIPPKPQTRVEKNTHTYCNRTCQVKRWYLTLKRFGADLKQMTGLYLLENSGGSKNCNSRKVLHNFSLVMPWQYIILKGNTLHCFVLLMRYYTKWQTCLARDAYAHENEWDRPDILYQATFHGTARTDGDTCQANYSLATSVLILLIYV